MRGIVQGGRHDHGNEIGGTIELEPFPDGEAVRVREHEIEENEIGMVPADHSRTGEPSSSTSVS